MQFLTEEIKKKMFKEEKELKIHEDNKSLAGMEYKIVLTKDEYNIIAKGIKAEQERKEEIERKMKEETKKLNGIIEQKEKEIETKENNVQTFKRILAKERAKIEKTEEEKAKFYELERMEYLRKGQIIGVFKTSIIIDTPIDEVKEIIKNEKVIEYKDLEVSTIEKYYYWEGDKKFWYFSATMKYKEKKKKDNVISSSGRKRLDDVLKHVDNVLGR